MSTPFKHSIFQQLYTWLHKVPLWNLCTNITLIYTFLTKTRTWTTTTTILTNGSFSITFDKPLKNCDFCRLSFCTSISRYCSVITPTSSKYGICIQTTDAFSFISSSYVMNCMQKKNKNHKTNNMGSGNNNETNTHHSRYKKSPLLHSNWHRCTTV